MKWPWKETTATGWMIAAVSPFEGLWLLAMAAVPWDQDARTCWILGSLVQLFSPCQDLFDTHSVTDIASDPFSLAFSKSL